MYFDCLDEIYAIVQSNWHFHIVTQIGLTSLHDRSDLFAQIVQHTQYLPILDVNKLIRNQRQNCSCNMKEASCNLKQLAIWAGIRPDLNELGGKLRKGGEGDKEAKQVGENEIPVRCT